MVSGFFGVLASIQFKQFDELSAAENVLLVFPNELRKAYALVVIKRKPLVVNSTHAGKNGYVGVEFKTPSKSGKKSASLKKLKIVKTSNSMHSAWTKVS